MTIGVDGYDSYFRDPAYRAALAHFQGGEWQAGLDAVEALSARYPLERDLRLLHHEMLVRARVDEDEQAELAQARQRRIKSWVARLVGAGLAVALAAFALSTYLSWLRHQVVQVQSQKAAEVQEAQLDTLYRDALVWQRAGQLDEARALFERIAAIQPNYPGLQAAREQLDKTASLEAWYAEAMGLIERQDWDAARSILSSIAAQDANYEDVALQLANLDRLAVLHGLLAQAQAGHAARQWQAAAAQYESVRALDPGFEAERIEASLFECYVEAAQAALVGQKDLLKALSVAESYFAKALALRPLDPQIKTSRELARLYLKAQSDFNEGRWSDAITDLGYVYAADPSYALGTTRQALYEAYVARGDAALAAGSYESALGDYQRAIDFAAQDPQAVLRLYEAYLKAAEARAGQRDFEGAVLNYRRAVVLAGLNQRPPEGYPVLATELAEAEKAVAAANFLVAVEHYARAIALADATQPTATHVVKAGEYLILIATLHGSTVSAIVAANNIPNPRLIYEGQKLIVPLVP